MNKRHLLMRFFAGIFISAVVSWAVLGSPQSPYDDAEAYQVYAAVIPTEWTVAANKARALVIQSETVPYKNCLRATRQSQMIVEPAIADYVKRNEQTWSLT